MLQSLIAGIVLLSLPVASFAWEPNAGDLDTAINTGDFAGYFANISAWLDQKTPAEPGKISEATMVDLIKDPVFRNTLDQRQFIVTHGVNEISVFAKVEAHRAFLAWIMKNTQIMDLYLEANTPTGDQPTDIKEFKTDPKNLRPNAKGSRAEVV